MSLNEVNKNTFKERKYMNFKNMYSEVSKPGYLKC